MKKYILYAATVVVVIGTVIGYNVLTPSPEIKIQDATTDLVINATKLYGDFSLDEGTANQDYVGKVLEVKGMLKNVEKKADNEIQLVLDAEDDLGAITCNLQVIESLAIEELKIGDPITVKGVCTGYLFDVVLDHSMVL